MPLKGTHDNIPLLVQTVFHYKTHFPTHFYRPKVFLTVFPIEDTFLSCISLLLCTATFVTFCSNADTIGTDLLPPTNSKTLKQQTPVTYNTYGFKSPTQRKQSTTHHFATKPCPATTSKLGDHELTAGQPN